MTLDELNTIFDAACSTQAQANREMVTLWSCRRAGIRAVVTALRDEFGRIMEPSDDWNRMGIVGVFNEILASDGEEAAGSATRLDSSAPAPAAAYCHACLNAIKSEAAR